MASYLLARCLFLAKVFILVASSEDCSRFIQALSKHDAFLNGRKTLATELMKSNVTAAAFVESLNGPNVTAGGKYQCGNTRFWIDGLYRGPLRQFEELRGSLQGIGYGAKAGYEDFAGGDKLIQLFRSYERVDSQLILYKFQTYGAVDHVWAVLQSPGPKYKVFQSYNMAYSLHAWLAKSIDGMYEEGFIRFWDDVFLALKAFISSEGGSVNADGTFSFPDSFTEAEKQWAYQVRDYDQADIEANLLNASLPFGRNEFISQREFLEHYLTPLSHLIDSMLPMVTDDDALWTQAQHVQWIKLFGSPNPVAYPGVKFRRLAALLGLPPVLELQVRVDIIENDEKNGCEENYELLLNTIPSSNSKSLGYTQIRSTFAISFTILLAYLF